MNYKYKITLLDEEEFNYYFPYGSRYTQVNDFAIALGASVDFKRSSFFWLKNDIKDIDNLFPTVTCIDTDGLFHDDTIYDETVAIRPVMNFSQLEKYANIIEDVYKHNSLVTIEFGEYPQSLVTYYENIELEKAYQKNLVKKTGKVYTTVRPYIDDDGDYCFNNEFIPYENIEYEYEGKKYVRVVNSDSIMNVDDIDWTNHLKDYKNIYWINVEPIEWLADFDNNIAISIFCLISGMCYHYSNNNEQFVKFEDTTMYKYLNKYFAKEILPEKVLIDNIEYKINSYNDKISKKFK